MPHALVTSNPYNYHQNYLLEVIERRLRPAVSESLLKPVLSIEIAIFYTISNLNAVQSDKASAPCD